MQIFWVSSPVGEIKRINLTLQTLIGWLGVAMLCFVSVGVVIEFVRHRITPEGDLDLEAASTTSNRKSEIENLKDEIAALKRIYQTRLANANKQAEATQHQMKEQLALIQKQATLSFQKVKELELANQKLVAMASPPIFQKDKQKAVGLGGPFLPENKPTIQTNLPDVLTQTLEDFTEKNQLIDASTAKWHQQIDWLAHKPIGIPVDNNVSISSPFGTRIDPITNAWSRHLGLDFQTSMGTPILASGAGVVEKAGWDPEYGNEVIINHGEGIFTRYAHSSQLLVKAGDVVERLQIIAKAGRTGRATGPHLHFEVIKDNQAIDPSKVLVGMGR